MLESYSDHIAPHSDAIQDFDSQDHMDRTGQCNNKLKNKKLLDFKELGRK